MNVIKSALALTLAAASVAAPCAAQEALTIGAEQRPMLRAGTSVPLKTLTELTTKGKKLRVGDRFNLEVAEPVMVEGVTVIPVGSPAIGEVTSVRNKGMWGKSGAIEVRMLDRRLGMVNWLEFPWPPQFFGSGPTELLGLF